MASVKIISGHTNPGGSTAANINLCNLLNSFDVQTTLYGPHSWHLGQCMADMTANLRINRDDILIVHYLVMPERPDTRRKVILSCHETTMYPIRKINDFWDAIHFVSRAQREWHGVNGVVIPNRITRLERYITSNGIAGVIGSIDPHKQTHISIQRALQDGYETVYLYGEVTDRNYYGEHVKGYVESGKVVMQGHEVDKQKMYDSLEAVYHSSVSETFNLIRAECRATGTPYHGADAADPDVVLYTDKELYSAWTELLEIDSA